MTRISEKELQGLLPNLKNLAGIDPRAELRLTEAFRRIYEIMNLRLNDQTKAVDSKLQSLASVLSNRQHELNNLIGSLSQPLVGEKSSEFVLQSIVSTNGDLIADKLNANGTILSINAIIEGEYLRRSGNSIISGTPVGTTTLKDGILDDAEAIIYTTPLGHRTKLRHLFLFNNTAGTLPVDILAKDPANNPIFANNFNMLTQEKRLETLNIILPANYTFRGFSSAEGAIEYTLFGIEEPL